MASKEEDKKPMNPKVVIRSETDADVSAIAEVTVAAVERQLAPVLRNPCL